MRLLWTLLCEAVVRDASNTLTLIGLNRNVVVARTLPATTKRALVLHIGDLSRPDEMSVRIQLVSPSGETVASTSGLITLKAGESWGDEIEGFIDIPLEMQLQLAEYGQHRFMVRVESGEDLAEEELVLYVTDKPRYSVIEIEGRRAD